MIHESPTKAENLDGDEENNLPPHLHYGGGITSVVGEVYFCPRRQLIFRFGGRVIYHSKGLSKYIPK